MPLSTTRLVVIARSIAAWSSGGRGTTESTRLGRSDRKVFSTGDHDMKIISGCCLGLLLAACGAPASDESALDSSAQELTSGPAVFTGHLAVSSTSLAVGTPFTVTESATNLTANQVGPVIVGIYRVGFNVTAVQKPRTGICRIAGSATCNFLELAGNETQSYTLTLVPTAPGTFTIKGWATSSYVTGGASEAVTVTVH
jgi:hypothetical protein